jgi:predicted nuclease with RNAse H fold
VSIPGIWAGVDVGGRRKGFHIAVIDDHRVLALENRTTVSAAAAFLGPWHPRLVAIDSPCALAEADGFRRHSERRLAAAVCRLRYTPSGADLDAQKRKRRRARARYYEWIEHGRELYEALETAGLATIECFPTACWTEWYGRRDGEGRAIWSTAALTGLGIDAFEWRLGQDGRDAIAAALTAWQAEHGECRCFGDIVVPRQRPTWQGVRR